MIIKLRLWKHELYAVPSIRLSRLQNAAARLVAGARRCDHISPVLAELYWLPIRQRITFNIAVLVWKCLHDKAPHYLADLCIPVTSVEGRRQLQRLEPFSCPEFGLPLASGASRCSAPQPGTVYLLCYELPNLSLIHI